VPPHVPPDSFAAQLRRIRQARGLTLEALARLTPDHDPTSKGLTRDAIAQLETKPDRRPKDENVLILGRALQAQPGEFEAYDLAHARSLLDEHVVGPDLARKNLAAVAAVLQGSTGRSMRG
jgi:transcriptional regulator with XRE-family HTH domain